MGPSYKELNKKEVEILENFANDVLIHGTKLALNDANITCNSDRDTMIKNFMKREDSIIRKFWEQSAEEEEEEEDIYKGLKGKDRLIAFANHKLFLQLQKISTL